MVLKIVAEGRHPWRYFSGSAWKWNTFDFFIVIASLPIFPVGGSSVYLLRLIRLARLGKLLGKVRVEKLGQGQGQVRVGVVVGVRVGAGVVVWAQGQGPIA